MAESPPTGVTRRLFLVGCPRSGTTLLQSLLAAHPRLTSFPETHAFAWIVPRHPRLSAFGMTRVRGWGPLRALWRELAPGEPVRLSDLLLCRAAARRTLALLDRVALARGRQGWVEKTPRHLHSIPAIRAACPDAHFIHLLRSGPEVVASLFEASREAPAVWGGARSVERCVERWRGDVALSLGYRGQPGHTLVLYGELVADPERTLRRLSAELDLDFEAAMLAGYRREAAALVRCGETWKRGVLGEIRHQSGAKAERLFDAPTLAWIEAQCRELNHALARLHSPQRADGSER